MIKNHPNMNFLSLSKLYAGMINLPFFVKQFEESEENDLINNSKKLIQALNNKDTANELHTNKNQSIFLFSFHPELENSLCNRIFHVYCNRPFLLKYKSNWKILISLITQLASFDFKYFVDNYVPIMIKGDEKMLYILAYVSSIILNPLSGFLYHILSSQQYTDEKKKYNFFDHKSPDLNTPIGQTLTKFRKILIDLILRLKGTQNTTVSFNTSSSIYTYSIFYPYEHSEIPYYSNLDEISLGFSEKDVILHLSSFFLNQEIYTKEKQYFLSNNEILKQWEKYYTEITGFEVHQKTKEIPLYHMESTDNIPILFQYLKIIPFLALSSLQTIIKDEMELIAQILGEDPISASFYQCLCQILILNDGKFAIRLFDSILILCENLGNLSNNQYHTLIHSTYRFIDALSIHQNCILNDNHITKLNSLALIGLCSIHTEIRKASLKLIEALGRLNSTLFPISDFIVSNSELFEFYISEFFENYEQMTSLILPPKKRPNSPLTLEIAISSPSPTIWHIFLLSIGKAAAMKLPSTMITKFKEFITSIFPLPDTELETQLKISQNLTISYNMSSSLSSHFSLNSLLDISSYLVPDQSSNTNLRVNFNSIQSSNSIHNSNSIQNSISTQNSMPNQNSNQFQNPNFVQSSNSFSKENSISSSYFTNNLKLSKNFASDTNSSVDISDTDHLDLNSNINTSSEEIGNEYLASTQSRHLNFDCNSDSYLIYNFNSKPKIALSLNCNSNSEAKNVLNPTFPIQIMTLLLPMTKVNDSFNSKIIRTINFFLKSFYTTHLNSLLLMIKAIPTEIFESTLDMLLNENDIQENPFSQLAFIWSISWSNNFFDSKELIEKLIDVFINVTVGLSNNGLLFFTLTTTSSRNEEKIMSENAEELTIFTTVCHRILTYLFEKFKEVKSECFPCCPYVDSLKHQELLKFSLLYAPLLNMSLFESKSRNNIGDRLRLFSIQALSQFFSCCKIDNTYFLFNDISVQFERIIYFCPSILQHFLEHNFNEVFPIFLQKALKPNGILYIKALAHFFRASEEGLELSTSDILTKQQWTNINPINRLSDRLQIIYDNCGSFLFACVLYIIISDSNVKNEVFILLITIAPILLLLEDGGNIDNTRELLNQIAVICSELDHPTSNEEIDRLFGLGEILSSKFSFCTEQFLKSAFDYLPSFKPTKINIVLLSLVPWFESINFDYEERIFSKETDFQFINFSCYTFIEIFVSSFPPPKDFSSSIYSIWKSLVIKSDKTTANFLPTLHILFDMGEKEDKNAKSLVNLVQFLFSLNPSVVMMFVTSRISFSNYFEKHKNQKEKKNIDNYRFIIKCLIRLCRQSIHTSFPYLNLIFSFSVVFRPFYFHEIYKLMKCVITSIEPFITNKIKASHESLKSSLNRISSGFKSSDESDCFNIKTINEQDFAFTNPITDFDPNEIYDFLKAFDENLSLGYTMELLRWGLCCGDLTFSTSALNAHPNIFGEIVIGLTARALSSVSLAIIHTTLENKPIYIKYIQSVVSFLYNISNSKSMLNDNPNSSIFWISCELLKCRQRDIFIEALKLFDSFVSNESNFELVNGSIPPDQIEEVYSGKRKVFTELSLFKFHSPWNEEYEGCLKYILLNARSEFESVVNVLLHLVQIKYEKILSNKKNGFSMVLLALLPYFWANLSLSIKSSSKKINEIKKTINSLQKIENCLSDSLKESILVLKKSFDFSNRSKLRELMVNAADLLIKDIDNSDLQMIAAFYTSAFEYGQKQMMIPIVVIATKIARSFPDILANLKNFSFLITKTEISSIKGTNNFFACREADFYEFLSLFNKNVHQNESQKNSDKQETLSNQNIDTNNKQETHSNNQDIEINNKKETFNNNQDIETNNKQEVLNNFQETETHDNKLVDTKILDKSNTKNDNNDNNNTDNEKGTEMSATKNNFDSNSTTFTTNDEDDSFPFQNFFDRIVVVLIPHLFESNIGYQVNFEFNDLNLFPPLLPYDESIMRVEKFQNLQNFVQQIEIFPFIDWERIMKKMKFFIHDASFSPQKIIAKTPQINVGEILIDEFCKEMEKCKKIREYKEEEEEKENEEEDLSDQIKNNCLEIKDVFNLVPIEASTFIPSIELANSIGDDLFDETNS